MGLVRERLRTVKYPSINRLAHIEVAKTKQSKQVQRVQRTSLHHRRRLSTSFVLLTVGATGIAC